MATVVLAWCVVGIGVCAVGAHVQLFLLAGQVEELRGEVATLKRDAPAGTFLKGGGDG